MLGQANTSKLFRCPHCNAIANPRWDECVVCAMPLTDEPVMAPIICILCGEPVERGTPGTGALAGQDLHMSCWDEDKHVEAEERAAIQAEGDL